MIVSKTACFFLLFFSLSCDAFSQSSGTANDSTAIIAILPANVNITLNGKQKATVSRNEAADGERQVGVKIQSMIFDWFMENSAKYRYNIILQNFNFTNKKLSESGLSNEDIKKLAPDSLARLLHVNAVVLCKAQLEKGISDKTGKAAAEVFMYGVLGAALATYADFKIIATNHKSENNIWPQTEDIFFQPANLTAKLLHILKYNAKAFPFRSARK